MATTTYWAMFEQARKERLEEFFLFRNCRMSTGRDRIGGTVLWTK